MGRIGDAAVEPLIEALNDSDRMIRRYAAYALGEIGDARAVEVLDRALMNRDYEVIAGAYSYFIRKVRKGSEEVLIVLIDTLNRQGHEEMAEGFLNCGNERLEEAAREWADKHGYWIPGQ